jgi:hypothetical protein
MVTLCESKQIHSPTGPLGNLLHPEQASYLLKQPNFVKYMHLQSVQQSGIQIGYTYLTTQCVHRTVEGMLPVEPL